MESKKEIGKVGKVILVIYSILIGEAIVRVIMFVVGVNLFWFVVLFVPIFAVVIYYRLKELIIEIKKQ